MLTSVKKGKSVNEEEIPPPVALGGKPNVAAEPERIQEKQPPQPTPAPSPPTNEKPVKEASPVPPNAKPMHLTPPQKSVVARTPETPAISPLTPSQPDASHSGFTSCEDYSVISFILYHILNRSLRDFLSSLFL